MDKTKLNQAIWSIPMADRINRLPISETGFPVPWFVAWLDGKPDFRVIGPDKLVQAVKRSLCWTCGQPLGQYKAFPIGPMCAINRTIAEPPSHLECAEYAVRACPFLSNPRMRRNEKDMPAGHQEPAGMMIKRNPGAVCIWVTKEFRVMRDGNGAVFRLGDPTSMTWWAEGRRATRAEVDHSIQTGLPLLRAEAEKEGPEALAMLDRYIARAQRLLPP
ncbi:hypothetical protein [Bradyrhizobium sp. 2S1]|uniref:hypothetical protein n=1 Tax=Bradyrhizobium sp. 2S1 TaxID=1404429 RepID=UPI001CD04E9F|nr:hypothetical protein [Bradyrhizobium sp. 2S1]MCK7672354.1 hypothetical protein [Bradyrhizobium sp. 2S1]